MKFAYYIFLPIMCSLIAMGCSSSFSVTNEYIKGSNEFNYAFIVSNIVVDSIDRYGRPTKFETDTVVYCYPLDHVNGTRIENFEHRKKLYFKKANIGYEWWIREPHPTNLKHETLPLKLSNDRWYLIGGLKKYGEASYSIFIYIDSEGEWHIYHDYKPGPW